MSDEYNLPRFKPNSILKEDIVSLTDSFRELNRQLEWMFVVLINKIKTLDDT